MYRVKIQLDKFKCIVSVNTNMSRRVFNRDTGRHSNLQYELHIPLSGKCVIDVEKNEYPLGKGDALLILPGKYHSHLENTDDYIPFVVSFQISADEEDMKTLISSITPCLKFGVSGFDVNVCEKIFTETGEKIPYWKENLYALYSLLFTSLFRNISPASAESAKDNSVYDDNRFLFIDNFFERNLAENCTEEDLCRELNLSRRQLSRVLKMNYGMAFREKMHKSRMDMAEWMLTTSDYSVSKICELTGYNSETSFFKAFKKHTGMTPKNYRKTFSRKKEF